MKLEMCLMGMDAPAVAKFANLNRFKKFFQEYHPAGT